MRYPLLKVEIRGTIQRYGIAIEQVWHQRVVAVSSKLIREELAVLPDPDDVRQEQYRRLRVHGAGGKSYICVVLAFANLRRLATGIATGGRS
jgi:hypothetical protein